MTALVIKNLPDDLLARLRERAKANHRSLTKEAMVLLAQGVGYLPVSPAAAEPLATVEAPRSTPLPTIKVAGAAAHPVEAAGSEQDGRDALLAALVKQPDGSYINLLGIDDPLFFEILDNLRTEFRLPEPPDFGGGH